MNPTQRGRRAEDVAASFLVRKGCEIVSRNWRTRWCEIDIVAHRSHVVYFCEVKYRANSRQGSGVEYVTPRKLQQMHFAAEFWVAKHGWNNTYEICAIEVSGEDYRITGVFKTVS
jgi:uncharacterized protein (TIGR00252 family)